MTSTEHKSESTGGAVSGSARGSGTAQADVAADSDRSAHDFECLRCAHKWRAQRRNAAGEPIAPAQCARCRSAYWNVAPDAKSTRARRPGDPRWPTPPTSTERRARKKQQAEQAESLVTTVPSAPLVAEARTPLGPPRTLSALVPPPPLSASVPLAPPATVTRTPVVPPPPRIESEPQPESTFKPRATSAEPISYERLEREYKSLPVRPDLIPVPLPSAELADEADQREEEALDAPAD